MAAFLHFRVNSVGVNLEQEVSRWREEDRERNRQMYVVIKHERREDKWTELKQSQTEDGKKGADILFGHSADNDSDSISSTPKLRCSSSDRSL